VREEASRLLEIARDSHQLPICTCKEVEETIDGVLHEPKCPMVPFAKALWQEAMDRWMDLERAGIGIPKTDWEPEADDADL